MEVARVLDTEFCTAGAGGDVIAVDIAALKARATARPVREIETCALTECTGRIAARQVEAGINLPLFDNSAMDGFAVRCRDFTNPGPWVLPVSGRVAAGQTADELPSAPSAVRIFTGAPVPSTYDAVIMQEHCRVAGSNVTIEKAPRVGENIRRTGEDVRAGDALMQPGMTLTPSRLALLAAQGLARVEVFRRVRVGLIATGSELREPGEAIGLGQIYNSNRIMIRSALSVCRWAEIIDYGIVADDRGALAAVIGEAATSCDVLITSGGVSAGDEDHVVGALAQHRAALEILKVAMRPGKPVKVGRIGDMLVTALPGNPNAALVTFHQIALPAIRVVAGMTDVLGHWEPAVAGFRYQKRLGRTEFVPVRAVARDGLGRPILEMLGPGSSARLAAMAMADGIAVLPPEIASIAEGLPLRFEAFARF